MKYFQKAVELKDAPAYANIVLFYEHGYFDKPDRETALKYYQAAADLGDRQGKIEYACLAGKMDWMEDVSQSAGQHEAIRCPIL